MQDNHETFTYTYSAQQREEVQRIREKYAPKEESKLEKLRRLDQSVTKRGCIISIILGTVSSLVLALGICCTMVWAGALFVPGIIIGIVGLAGIGAACPLYYHIVKKDKERIAPQILKLTDELMQ